MSATAIVIRRVIPVPREEIFAAWLDPATLALFMRPGATTKATAEVDARVGGKFRIVMFHGDEGYEHRGEYLEIDPPSRLSFTWISVNTDLQPTIVTVEFHDRGGSTELVLTHRGLPEAQVEPHTKGWTDIAYRLEDTLVSGPRRRSAR
ncbi:MAG TPA: SRPBCC domain-containing protein [Thermoanaerobaculia bacterium]